MFGEQFDRRAICNRVGLRQIPHGFDQQALAIYVAWIGRSLTPARNFGGNGNGKNLGNEFCL